MKFQSCTTFAAIMRADKPDFCISELANEILQSKTVQHLGTESGSGTLSWHSNQLVFIDYDTVRIALQDVPATQDKPSIVCVAVGAVSGKAPSRHIDSAALARDFVKRVTELVDAKAVLWNVAAQPPCPEVMDDFQHELDNMLRYLDLQLKTAQHAAKKRIPSIKSSLLNDPVALDDLRTDLRNSNKVGDVHTFSHRTSIYAFVRSYASACRRNVLGSGPIDLHVGA
jgi:hypothetical protein